MRIVLLGLAFLVMALSAGIAPVDAQNSPRPWCLRTGGHGPTGGLNDCSYSSLQQCRASLGGGTDQCLENPALAWDRLEGKRSGPARLPRSRGY